MTETEFRDNQLNKYLDGESQLEKVLGIEIPESMA